MAGIAMDALGRRVRACRTCGSGDLELYLDLGHTPPADQFLRPEQLNDAVAWFPLQVFACMRCGLSQLGYVVRPEILYQEEYPYEASTTQAGRAHFRDFAAAAVRQLGLRAGDLAVDIGSNVGVLLSGFRAEGMRVLGIDPAENIASIARARGIPTIADFFCGRSVDAAVRDHGQAAVITGTNVFAHIDDLDALMADVDRLLAPDGVFIFEAPYFVNLLRDLEYDTIYHEHLSYVSLAPLIPFFERHGMRVFDVQEVDIHGGSFRVFVDRGERARNDGVIDELLARERSEGAHDIERLRRFADGVAQNRRELVDLLRTIRGAGKRIAGVSAPAKGMTLLNYCRIGTETLDFVTEKSSLKIGRVTPGTHIPVTGDDALMAQAPEFALLLAWNFAEEIMANLSAYQAAGGRFIVPIPHPHIVVSEKAARVRRSRARVAAVEEPAAEATKTQEAA